MTEIKIEYLPITSLEPYSKNTRKHGKDDVDKIALSIEKYGMNDPIGIWSDHNVIVEGHGRMMACLKLGYDTVPCIRLDHLTDEQRREYAIMHNKTAELSDWDYENIAAELPELNLEPFEIDWGLSEHKSKDKDHFWGDEEGETNEEYQEFEDKFKPKLTTDDCYTPENIYSAVESFAIDHYNLKDRPISRPFYPGGDYRSFDYPEDSVVIDNPPFSILSEIVRFYMEKNQDFFLFAPTLTLFSTASGECNYVPTGVDVTYENGAKVTTSFITNLGQWKIELCPALYNAVKEQDEINTKSDVELPNYVYPDAIITSAGSAKLTKYEQTLQLKASDVIFTRGLDSQKEQGKAIYGGGFLLSEKAAAEKAAAEKAAAEKAAAEKAAAEIWTLSDREINLQKRLGREP